MIFERQFGFPSFLFTPKSFAVMKQITLLATIPFAALTSFLGYMLANKRNRDKISWALICLFFSFLGLLYLYFMPSRPNSNDTEEHQ
jgi:FtsH-binding integral membrane protein